MRTVGLLAAACGAAVVALASTAGASPLAGSASKGLSGADLSLVEPVHGCHREVLFDRWGWHYHRRNCRRVDVPPPDYGPGPYGPGPYGPGPGCYWVGPVRICP
jgi:hypothetical protein